MFWFSIFQILTAQSHEFCSKLIAKCYRHCVVCKLSCMLSRPSPVCWAAHWMTLARQLSSFSILFYSSFNGCCKPICTSFNRIIFSHSTLLYFMAFYFGCCQSVCEYGCHLTNENKNINHNHHKDNMIMITRLWQVQIWHGIEINARLYYWVSFASWIYDSYITLSVWRHTINMWIQLVFLSDLREICGTLGCDHFYRRSSTSKWPCQFSLPNW